jgi:acetyl esterase/lipase
MKHLVTLLLAFVSMAAFAQKEIPLYPKEIPNSKPTVDSQTIETNADSIVIIGKVSRPTLTIYEADRSKANGAAFVVVPGGGYHIVAKDHEGDQVARKMAALGYTAFVLKYRIPSDQWMINKEIGPLQDAQRAIQYARENAAKYHFDAHRLGIIGFSAGGHLASTAGTHFNRSYIPNKKNTSLRPDFMVLVYPVISFTDSVSHKGSMEALLGANPPQDKRVEYSGELQVTPETPPTFLVHAKDDWLNYRNSILFADALEKNGVGHDVYLYEKGGHGFGLHNKTSDVQWIDLVDQWVRKLPEPAKK